MSFIENTPKAKQDKAIAKSRHLLTKPSLYQKPQDWRGAAHPSTHFSDTPVCAVQKREFGMKNRRQALKPIPGPV